MCVTPETVKAALTPRTKAVIAVHLFGNVAPVAEIEALGVPVLEDAAQAAGSAGPAGRPGALGTIATFSFYPSKNLGAFGDGGAITTDDAALADAVRTLRFHGSQDKVTYDAGRLQQPPRRAAGGDPARRSCPHLDALGRRPPRRRRALRGGGLGELVDAAAATEGARPAWHLYVVRHERPDELRRRSRPRGIGAQRPTTARPCTASPRWPPTAPASSCRAPTSARATHLAIPIPRRSTRDAGRRGRRRACAMRVWIDLTN